MLILTELFDCSIKNCAGAELKKHDALSDSQSQ